MDIYNIERDPVTMCLESGYARKVFFGDITFEEVPDQFKEEVKKELKENDLEYLYE